MPVMGLDASLRATGICILEHSGEGTGFLRMVAPFEILHLETVGYDLKRKDPERERIERQIYIAKRVVDRVKEFDVSAVGIENYAFRQRGMGISLAELGGVVKSQLLLACNIESRMIVASMARKDLFGKMPQKGAKKESRKRLDAEGLEFETDHEADAFVMALFLLRQLVHEAR